MRNSANDPVRTVNLSWKRTFHGMRAENRYDGSHYDERSENRWRD